MMVRGLDRIVGRILVGFLSGFLFAYMGVQGFMFTLLFILIRAITLNYDTHPRVAKVKSPTFGTFFSFIRILGWVGIPIMFGAGIQYVIYILTLKHHTLCLTL